MAKEPQASEQEELEELTPEQGSVELEDIEQGSIEPESIEDGEIDPTSVIESSETNGTQSDPEPSKPTMIIIGGYSMTRVSQPSGTNMDKICALVEESLGSKDFYELNTLELTEDDVKVFQKQLRKAQRLVEGSIGEKLGLKVFEGTGTFSWRAYKIKQRTAKTEVAVEVATS